MAKPCRSGLFVIWLLIVLLCGAPIFAVLGGLALALFWQEGQPLAAVPLSHYQITVNPSLPACRCLRWPD
jgi:C4-dicarboxylate transporter, DctM subunit